MNNKYSFNGYLILQIMTFFLFTPLITTIPDPCLFGDEFLLDTCFSSQPIAEGEQDSSSVAYDGTNYLVVWQDNRYNQGYNIMGARVNNEGGVIDSLGIVICSARNNQLFPSVAFNGTNYMVVWQDKRNGNFDVYGARVTPSGTVMDTAGIPIAIGTLDDCNPVVAGGNGIFLVVWETYNTIYGSINDSIFKISHDTLGGEYPAVSFDGTNFLVAWEHYSYYNIPKYDIFGARVNRYGWVLDPRGIPISTARRHKRYPSVAFNGQNYLVIWEEHNISLDSIILFGTRVNPNGTVLDTSGILIVRTPLSDPNVNVSAYTADFPGGDYLVLWNYNYRVMGARINPSGLVLDTSGVIISPRFPYIHPTSAAAFGAENYLVTWSQGDIQGTLFSPLGYPLDTLGFTISRSGAPAQTDPAVAFDGENYLVAWIDYFKQSGYRNLKAVRVSPDEQILDPNPILIKTSQYLSNPRVVYGDSNYFVIWRQYHTIYGTRINKNGIILDTNSILLANSWNYITGLAFDGTNYLLTFVTDGLGLKGRRINQNGIIIDTNFINISNDTDMVGNSTTAYNGDHYQVIWEVFWNGGLYTNLYGVRVSREGAVIDFPIDIDQDESHVENYPALTCAGSNYLVAWGDGPAVGLEHMYGTRIDQNGVIIDPDKILICADPGKQTNPAVTCDGTNYFVVWHDIEEPLGSPPFYLRGTRISPTSGIPIDYFWVSNQSDHQEKPALGHGSGNQILMIYSRFTQFYHNRPVQAMRIWGKFYPFTGISEDPTIRIDINQYELQVYPNPIREKLTINYFLRNPGNVKISLYDLTGRLVKILANYYDVPGINKKIFKLSGIPNGIYFITIRTADLHVVKKFIYIE